MPHFETSPFTVNGYEDGLADGQRDAELMSMCPPQEPLGMDGMKEWSWRYRHGYEEAFQPTSCGHSHAVSALQ